MTTSTSPIPDHVSRPPTEVTPKAKRRTYTAEYKQRILAAADACGRGELGALLRREGLYSSHLVEWRRARHEGALAGLAPAQRGPKVEAANPLASKLAATEREVARLKAENTKLQLVCDVQKKVSQLLEIALPTIPDDDKTNESAL